MSSNPDLSVSVDHLIEDLIIPNTLHHLREFARLSVGKRGTQAWLNSLRSVGTLLACLTDEQYSIVCREFVTLQRNPPSLPLTPSPSPSPSPTFKRLFDEY